MEGGSIALFFACYCPQMGCFEVDGDEKLKLYGVYFVLSR